MEEELLLWLWFAEVMGPSRPGFTQLLYQVGYLREIYERRSSSALAKLLKPRELHRARSTSLEDMRRRLELCQKGGVTVITYDSQSYPERLRRIAVPPVLLFCTGDPSLLEQVDAAAVGSRYMTRYGREAVRAICEPLAKAGVVLASGLARGVDAEVHAAVLKNGGRSVAVLGNGIDTTEPRRHLELRGLLESSGAVVSEFPPGAGCQPWMFPVRNRIVSGLSRAVMVFEAALHSGTMITADLAMEEGRDVLALPGSILSPQSAGTNQLIKDGAIPLLSYRDLLEALGMEEGSSPEPEKPPALPPLSGDSAAVHRALGSEALTPDELAARTGLSIGAVLACLTEMELDGAVASLPGGKYERLV